MENVLEYVGEKWQQLTFFSKKDGLKQDLLGEIVEHYGRPYRYYHNLSHIASLFELCDAYKAHLQSPALVGFAILYHDAVYDTFKDDNEQQSAALAQRHLQALLVKQSVIQQVVDMILATKTHTQQQLAEGPKDLQYFLDFDLAILAAPWPEYEAYSANIRKEYRQYPNDVYHPGRLNALRQMADKENLFYTDIFKEQFEAKARQNIFRETQLLTQVTTPAATRL